MKNLFFIMLFAASFAIHAAEQKQLEPTPTNTYDYSAWDIGIGYFSLDSEQAASQGIGDSGTFFKLGWSGQAGKLTYGLGLSGLLLNDKDSFTVTVDGPFSGTSNEDSTADAIGGFGELGYSYNFGNNGKFDLMAGVEFISATRGIGNCVDCPEEDIDLDSGLYIEPRVKFLNQNGFIFSMAYRKYLSADIDGGIILDFAWNAF